ncbi:MAG TPA: NUDIX domain-containing protein [Methylomirabilota bacterium]|nr:NUDIX domain-containing protein [Methylomirabilota bacterium]
MKIPPQAKKVFQGVIFSVYQWEQEMFDGSKATFEMLKRPNTIEILATQGDKILMSHQSQPNKLNYYSLFGGRAEEGEDPLVTAKRELLEESGLVSKDWDLFKIYEPYHKIDWQIYLYIARNCRKESEPKLDAGEKIEIINCTFEEFLKIVTADDYWGTELALDILKMKENNSLEAFKKRIMTSPTG